VWLGVFIEFSLITRKLKGSVTRMTTQQERIDKMLEARQGAKVVPYIIKGEESYKYPAVGLIKYENAKGSNSICTGTLISPQYVLTAAHCLYKNKAGLRNGNITFFIKHKGGGATRVLRRFRVVYIQGGYAPDKKKTVRGAGKYEDDIALIKLTSPVTTIRPIPLLPKLTKDLSNKLRGSTLLAMGFGRLYTPEHQESGSGRKRSGLVKFDAFMGKREFLTKPIKGVTACLGDSGGPAIFEMDGYPYIVGIVSTTDRECQSRTRYILVSPYLESFIHNIVGRGNLESTPTLEKAEKRFLQYQTYTKKQEEADILFRKIAWAAGISGGVLLGAYLLGRQA